MIQGILDSIIPTLRTSEKTDTDRKDYLIS